jgi:hypothetical protein
LESAKNVRAAIDAEVTVLKSIHIEDASFDSLIQGFRDDMEALGNLFDDNIAVYRRLLKGDRIVIPKTDDHILQFEGAALRVNAFGERAKQKKQEYEAQLNTEKAVIDRDLFKIHVLVPAAGAYVGLFSVLVWKRWKRQAIVANGK